MTGNYCDDHKWRTEKSESNCHNIETIQSEIDNKIWPAINSRPKISTLITITVIVAGILGASFTLLYSQAQTIAIRVELQGEKTSGKIDTLADTLRGDIRRIENQQMILQGSMDRNENKTETK